MVGVLIVLVRMKLTVLRHALTGPRATWMVAGGLIGLVLAAATLALSTLSAARPAALVDVLGLVYVLWLIGWIVAPLWAGRAAVLRADHFLLLPLARHRLAIGLLGAACVGIGPAVTMLAFASLPLYAARLGVAPALIALPALGLQLLLVVLGQVTSHVFSTAMQSRGGAAVSGVLFAALLVVAQSGWIVFVAIVQSGVLSLRTGLAPGLSGVVRALPSSWGLVAVEAARRSDWLLAAGALAGLAALSALLLLWWGRLLGAPDRARAPVRGSRGRVAPAHTGTHGWRPAGRIAAVIVKELRTWWRDPARTATLVLAPAWALMTGLLPLSLYALTPYATVLLPWTGAGLVLMAASASANLYGQDGTALWLTLLIPGAAQPDVRGRQWAWLLVFAPGAVAAAVLLTALSGQAWAWPWVGAVLPALLGGAAGLWVWAAVVDLAPGPDPRHGGDSLLDRPSGGMAYPLFWLAMLPAVPASAVVLAGTLLHSAVLRWSGVPVGLASGALLAWGISHLAAWRLEDRGPELLHLMRSGTPSGTPPSATPSSAARAAVFDTMPRGKRWLVVLLAMLGSIALFPQSLMPILLTLSDSQTRVWFLALYLPAAWRWPTIAGMLLLGLVAYGTALRLYLRHKEDGRRDCQHAGEQ